MGISNNLIMRLVHTAVIGLAVLALATDARRRKKGGKKKGGKKKGGGNQGPSEMDMLLANQQAFIDGLNDYGEPIDLSADSGFRGDVVDYHGTFRELSMQGLIDSGGVEYCKDMFGRGKMKKPTRADKHYVLLMERYIQCKQLYVIMGQRKEQCKIWMVNVVYGGKFESENKRHIQRRKYCSAIVRVPNPNKPCVRKCKSKDKACRKNRIACMKYREDRGLNPFSGGKVEDLNEDLGCIPITEEKTNDAAAKKRHQQAVQQAYEKYQAIKKKICRGNKARKRTCNAAKKKAFNYWVEIKNSKTKDSRPICDPTAHAPGTQHKKNKKKKHNVFSNNFREAQSGDDYKSVEDMEALLEKYEANYGAQAINAEINKQRAKGNKRERGGEDGDDVALAVVADDARD